MDGDSDIRIRISKNATFWVSFISLMDFVICIVLMSPFSWCSSKPSLIMFLHALAYWFPFIFPWRTNTFTLLTSVWLKSTSTPTPTSTFLTESTNLWPGRPGTWASILTWAKSSQGGTTWKPSDTCSCISSEGTYHGKDSKQTPWKRGKALWHIQILCLFGIPVCIHFLQVPKNRGHETSYAHRNVVRKPSRGDGHLPPVRAKARLLWDSRLRLSPEAVPWPGGTQRLQLRRRRLRLDGSLHVHAGRPN